VHWVTLSGSLMLLVSTAFLPGNGLSSSEDSPKEIQLVKRVYRNAYGDELPYQVLVPKGYDAARQYPLILFLHGAGERGSDNEAQLHHSEVLQLALDPQDPCFLVAPQCPAGDSWVPFLVGGRPTSREPGAPTKPMQLTIELLEQLAGEFNLDRSRWYVTGLSMGGFGTFDLLLRKPDWFAAGVPICGGMDVSRAKEIAHIPLWIFHGADDRVVSPELSRKAIKALQDAGAQPRYTEYHGVGHNVWSRAYCEPELRGWLLSQRRKSRDVNSSQ